VRNTELDSVTLMGPFQLETVNDSMISFAEQHKEVGDKHDHSNSDCQFPNKVRLAV